MARNNYAKGAARERQLQKELEHNGYVVTRSAGSRSPHDLVAIGPANRDSPSISQVQLIQVKADTAGPFHSFGPLERSLLSETARRAGAVPVLVWWPAGGKQTWYFEHEWPKSNA
jgi:Holliday junction resolvase